MTDLEPGDPVAFLLSERPWRGHVVAVRVAHDRRLVLVRWDAGPIPGERERDWYDAGLLIRRARAA
jgi:hypothetical protein